MSRVKPGQVEYRAIYKCRLCNKLFHSGACTGREIAFRHVVELAVNVEQPIGSVLPLLLSHHMCDDDGIGVADFVGWHWDSDKAAT